MKQHSYLFRSTILLFCWWMCWRGPTSCARRTTQKLVNTGIHAALLLVSPFYALFAVWMLV